MSEESPPAGPAADQRARSWFRIAAYPSRNPGNPSIEQFYRALAFHGVQLIGQMEPHVSWVDAHAGQIDAVHFHWPERLWRGNRKGRLDDGLARLTFRRWRRLLQLRFLLRRAAMHRMMRIWTIHNLEHHEGATMVDRVGYRLLIANSDLLLCYSESAAAAVRERYRPRAPVLAVPHAGYVGHYPPPRPRAEVIERLGLRSDLPVVSCVGLIREYKGIDVACEAVRSHLRARVQLVVAGAPWASANAEALRALAGDVPEIVLILRRLDDQEFADILGISEAVLLPYRKVTGSAVLQAAWASGCGVIASDLPFFREMIERNACGGLVFRQGDPEALADAIRRYLAIPTQARQAAATQLAGQNLFGEGAGPLLEVFRSWQAPHRASASG